MKREGFNAVMTQ